MRISDWSSDVCSSDLSLKSLEAGLALYPHFRRHISLSGPVTAAQVQAISEATGLKERKIRTLDATFRVPPVAETLAPKPRGPAVGSHRIDSEVRDRKSGV